jgi:hypothetical protein
MGQRSFGRNKLAITVIATTVAVLLWGLGVELVLHNYIFVLPSGNSIPKIN